MFMSSSGIEELKLGTWGVNEESYEVFEGMTSLKEIDLTPLRLDQVNSLFAYFWNDTSLTDVNFGNINTIKLDEIYSVFYNCSSLKKVDLSKFDTSNVTSFEKMFYGCSSLTELNLSNFDTSKAKNMQLMFADCTNLTKIKVGEKWNTTLAENTTYNFTYLDGTNYGAQNGIWYMFNNCGTTEVEH